MKIKISDEIFSKYGDVKVGVVKVEDFEITEEFKNLIEVKTKEAIDLFNEMISGKEISEIDSVKNWKNIYTKMGSPPSKISSIENLYSLVNERKTLPNINPIVDYYNAISCISSIPMGAYDTRKIIGNLILREARKGEEFAPMCLNQIEKTKNGEVIYADGEKVTCRYWNNKDSDKTKIDETTNQVLFFFDVSPEISKEYIEQVIEEFINELKETKVSDKIEYGIMDSNISNIEL